MIKVEKANSHDDFLLIVKLASIIIPEVYYPIVPKDHVNLFMKKYQTIEAIEEQISNNYHYYFLKYNEEVVGYLGITINNLTLLISKLYILKEFRAKKIGKLALFYAEEEARKYQCKSIELLVNEYNTSSIEFYKKYQYSIVELVSHDFEDGLIVRDYKMEKNLIY